ncbi:FAD-dependent oxidoreductase [Paraglaciecola sp.]|uniref:FAD-dependent oxidoreductase n=1 Tax=Paraglaciecola sp. TaxID=1920173 RepID=UPI003EF7B0A7
MVIINGAGIAGLTLANALHIKGIPYLIIEKSSELSEVGAGIILQNNGIAILQHLELFKKLTGVYAQQMMLGSYGNVNKVDCEHSGMSCFATHRAELQNALLKRLLQQNIKLSTQITNVEKHEASYKVSLSNRESLEADYVVNAAGINSNLHSEPEFLNSGHWCWRAILNSKQPISNSGEFWFGDQRIGFAPINEHQVYLYHVMRLTKPSCSKIQVDLDLPSTEQRIRWIKSKGYQVPEINHMEFSNANWLSHPLIERQIHWGTDNIVAIGDAAHAMTPNLGQGAVLAMEDAMVLSNLIAEKTTNLAQAIKKHRHVRVKKMQTTSRQFGAIAHHPNELFTKLIAFLMSLAPMNMMVKQQVRWMNQFINSTTWK